jgi:hypothetical protein
MAIFGFAESLTAFRNELQAASAGTIPSWKQDQSIQGFYWIDLGQEPRTVVKTKNFVDWEKIVGQIAGRADFQGEGCFYTTKLVELRSAKTILLTPEQRVYKLGSGRQYEFHIYHFHPIDVPPGTALSLTSASDWLKFTTNTSIAFDSRYDLKRVRLRVGYPSTQEFAVITISCSKPSTEDSGFQFDLPIQISGTFWRTLGFGAAIGVLLAAQQIFAVWNNPNLPSNNAVVSTIASLIIGLVTGILATFGLRKPV